MTNAPAGLRKGIRLAVWALLLAAAASPQSTTSNSVFAWWDSPIARDLGLTDAQTAQIRSIVKEFRAKLIDQRALVQKSELELESLFAEYLVDERKVNDAIERLVSARSGMTRIYILMSLRMRQVITAEQWRELLRRRPIAQSGSAAKPQD